jgi:hypothetical protein
LIYKCDRFLNTSNHFSLPVKPPTSVSLKNVKASVWPNLSYACGIWFCFSQVKEKNGSVKIQFFHNSTCCETEFGKHKIDKGCSFSLGLGEGLETPHREKNQLVTKCYMLPLNWHVVVNTEMKFRFHIRLSNYQLLKKDSTPWNLLVRTIFVALTELWGKTFVKNDRKVVVRNAPERCRNLLTYFDVCHGIGAGNCIIRQKLSYSLTWERREGFKVIMSAPNIFHNSRMSLPHWDCWGVRLYGNNECPG